jgi:hypothetical protein
MMRWGFVPAKIADPGTIKSLSTTNARLESILEKPIWKGPPLSGSGRWVLMQSLG